MQRYLVITTVKPEGATPFTVLPQDDVRTTEQLLRVLADTLSSKKVTLCG